MPSRQVITVTASATGGQYLEVMGKTTAAKVLGLYLFICATFQAGFWFIRSSFQSRDPLFFMNPRPELDPHLLRDGGRAYWISVIWLFIIAITILAKSASKVPIRFYVVLETLMMLPRIAFMLLYFLLSGGIWEPRPLHVDTNLAVQITIFVLFSLVPYVLAISVLETAKLLLRLAASLVLSVIVWFSLGSLSRSPVVGGIVALILLVSGVVWSVIPRKRTVPISPFETNSQ